MITPDANPSPKQVTSLDFSKIRSKNQSPALTERATSSRTFRNKSVSNIQKISAAKPLNLEFDNIKPFIQITSTERGKFISHNTNPAKRIHNIPQLSNLAQFSLFNQDMSNRYNPLAQNRKTQELQLSERNTNNLSSRKLTLEQISQNYHQRPEFESRGALKPPQSKTTWKQQFEFLNSKTSRGDDEPQKQSMRESGSQMKDPLKSARETGGSSRFNMPSPRQLSLSPYGLEMPLTQRGKAVGSPVMGSNKVVQVRKKFFIISHLQRDKMLERELSDCFKPIVDNKNQKVLLNIDLLYKNNKIFKIQ